MALDLLIYVSLLVLTIIPLYYLNILWLEPRRLRKKLERQGIRGPKPSFPYGNVKAMQKIQSAATTMKASRSSYGDFVGDDYTCVLFPYFEQWRKQYGSIYTYSAGNKQHLYINDPELVKEMNQSITLGLGKPSYITKRLSPLLGKGILRSNGHFWVHQRKIIAPEFFMDKVKGMVGLMTDAAEPLLRKWEACIEAQGDCVADIRVDDDLREVSADVISRACFGSSYTKGKEIFSKLRTLQKSISSKGMLFGLPKGVCIWSLIPTLHRDPEIWGPDAHIFKPERFANGVTKACKFPQAYVPFGVGARSCLGRNFAMAELKVIISLITSKFTYSLSPNYQHSPAYRMVVQPGHGINILIKKFQ